MTDKLQNVLSISALIAYYFLLAIIAQSIVVTGSLPYKWVGVGISVLPVVIHLVLNPNSAETQQQLAQLPAIKATNVALQAQVDSHAAVVSTLQTNLDAANQQVATLTLTTDQVKQIAAQQANATATNVVNKTLASAQPIPAKTA